MHPPPYRAIGEALHGISTTWWDNIFDSATKVVRSSCRYRESDCGEDEREWRAGFDGEVGTNVKGLK